jgi:type IV secretory pathway TrbF-like protein
MSRARTASRKLRTNEVKMLSQSYQQNAREWQEYIGAVKVAAKA